MLQPGIVISDRYKIIRVIGQGGMGAVYEAEHTGVGRHVAVKVLLPDFAKNPDSCARFEREARAAAEIGHDNIIDVLDVGVHDGRPFMVMEFLKGETLKERMERCGPLSPEGAAYVMVQALSALGAAHAAGIIHRDLKPDNLFLTTKAGLKDFVKLLDFGISKFSDDGEASTQPAESGALMGTLVYMSPEQVLARRDIDARSDLYSAGVMLYEMVTGKVPFDAASQAGLLREIVHRPEGMKAAREVNVELPAELDAVITKSVEKDRADRFESASAFAEALAPWVPQTPPAADATGTHAPLTKTVKSPTPTAWDKPAVAAVKSRGPGALIGGVGVSLVVAGMAIAVVLGVRRGSAPRAAPALAAVRTPPVATIAAPGPVGIDLGGLPMGATILVDGRPAESTHLTFERGTTHAIRVVSPDNAPYETSLTADRDREIVIALTPAPVAPVEAAAPTPHPALRGPAVGARIAPRAGAPVAHPASGGAAHPAATGTRGNPLLPVSNEF